MIMLNICNDADLLSILLVVKSIINIIKYIVPLILVVIIIINYSKAVINQDENELSKATSTSVQKIIAAIVVFLIPDLINLVTNIIDKDNNMYLSCIKIATVENVDNIRNETAKVKVEKAAETIDPNDYSVATEAVYKIKEGELKTTLSKKINEISKYVNIRNEIASLDNMSGNNYKSKYNELNAEISKISDFRINQMLSEELKSHEVIEEVPIYVSSKRPLELPKGLSELKTYGNMRYYEVIPPNPTTNMALWIFLHGDGGLTTGGLTNFIASGNAYTKEQFFYIAPSPIPFRQDWSGGSIPSDLKKLIDHIVSEYKIDSDRIIISGFSRGAIGTWTMVNNYPDLFSVAYPISCRPVGVDANNFKTTVVRAHAGTVYGKAGNYEGEYADAMDSFVKKIQQVGGDATMTKYKGKTHGEVNYVLQLPETIEFALSVKKKR